MPMTLEQWYRQMPVVTRSYLTLSFLTTAGCALELISPFSVYYNSHLIFKRGQLWRLATNFFFFGSLGMDFVFHMFFLSRYCRLLEEGTFRGRSGDFFWMLCVGGAMLSCVAPFVNIQFLGSSLTFMMVYVWGRRNRYVNMSFLGLFSFTAPYLPWVLLIFSVALGSSPVVDLLGMAAGHVYYYLEDVYPTMTQRRVLKTPALVKHAFGQREGGVDGAGAMGEWVPEPRAGVFAGGGGRVVGGGGGGRRRRRRGRRRGGGDGRGGRGRGRGRGGRGRGGGGGRWRAAPPRERRRRGRRIGTEERRDAGSFLPSRNHARAHCVWAPPQG
jgi:Derlin-2/3